MLSISKNQRTIAIFGILLLALIVAPSAQSYPYGVSGVQDAGCTCHGQSTSAVSYTHLTLPPIYSV